LELCDERGWHRIVLCGVSDLAEIVLLRTLGTDVNVVGVIDFTESEQKFLGRKVWRTLKAAEPFDCCVLTDLQSPQASYRRLIDSVGRERVLVPEILRL
jgi:hypothetical protein